MIRPATFSDIPAMIALLQHGYQRSVYQSIAQVDPKEARAFLMGAVQRHCSPNEGGTWTMVATTDGEVEGLFIGMLDRLYVVADRLRAIDVHYYGTERARPRDMIKLFDGFVQWAESIDKVVLVHPTATHILGDYSQAEKLFESRGFERAGVLYERRVG